MPRELTKRDTIEAILDAAERLLAHYGYGKMTMNDLAGEAGIGVGTIYLYFPGKAEVAIAVIDRSNRRVLEQLEAEAHSDAAPTERLRAMLWNRILLRYEIVRRRSHQLEEMRGAIRQQRAIQPNHARWFHEEKRLFAQVLREGNAMGVFAFDDAIDAAETLLWSMDSLMPHALKPDDFESPDAFREKTERLTEFVLRALRPLTNS